LVVIVERETITAEDVRSALSPQVTFSTKRTADGKLVISSTIRDEGPKSSIVPLEVSVRIAERQAIEHALRHAKGNRSLAARLLGVGRTTLYAKLEEHGLGKSED
jgi:DNA-binding NtrC family response regulator